MSEWRTLDDAEAVAAAACKFISQAAAEAIAARGEFKLVLAGGTTPLAAYRLLAATPQDWGRWHLYYGDERCLPADHPERNSQLVAQTGLSGRAGAHYPIPSELGSDAAAARYQELVQRTLPFDLVLLGMGEDGHTASLFPGRQWNNRLVLPVHDAPKPPPERVSLTLQALQACRSMLILVTGAGKQAATTDWRQGALLPISQVSAIPQATILCARDALSKDP